MYVYICMYGSDTYSSYDLERGVHVSTYVYMSSNIVYLCIGVELAKAAG
jgi:hypothetical protein